MKNILKNKKKCFLYLLLIIFTFGLLYSIAIFIISTIEEKNTNKQIKIIKNVTIVNEIIDNNKTEIIDNETNESDLSKNYTNINLINVDFNELKNINNDVKGWIFVPGTKINYPFVQTTDNSYYLKHSFDKSYNNSGWVFLDYRNEIDAFNDKNTILYAHNMRNKTMFGSLKNILTNGWLNNTNNHVIKLSTEYENTLWQVFSIYHIPKTSDYIKINFKNDAEYILFTNMLLNRSIHNFNTSISKNDRILTLSTCYSTNERLVLHAKLIKRELK